MENRRNNKLPWIPAVLFSVVFAFCFSGGWSIRGPESDRVSDRFSAELVIGLESCGELLSPESRPGAYRMQDSQGAWQTGCVPPLPFVILSWMEPPVRGGGTVLTLFSPKDCTNKVRDGPVFL